MLIRTRISKTLICIAVLIFTVALVSCGKKKTEEFTFRATITEIQNGSMLVTLVEDSEELRSSDGSGIPEKSIFLFQDNEGAKKLMEDMNDGNIPRECSVLYDEMGSRPEVTVTDAETITDLYDRLALMSVGEKSDMSITDSYHHIRFTLQDGTTVGWNFEGRDLLNAGTENYDVKDEGNLWFAVRQLQEKAMGYEEVTDYIHVRE